MHAQYPDFKANRRSCALFIIAAVGLLCGPTPSQAQTTGPTPQPQGATTVPPDQADQITPETWAVHGQATNVWQLQPAFHSPYQGPQRLSPATNGRETVDLTLYFGVRPWKGAEIWINPEIDQGFGLANTFGAAGYLSG
jgi:high affinity Mn2+ porin